jgi:hypothetical protein
MTVATTAATGAKIAGTTAAPESSGRRRYWRAIAVAIGPP